MPLTGKGIPIACQWHFLCDLCKGSDMAYVRAFFVSCNCMNNLPLKG